MIYDSTFPLEDISTNKKLLFLAGSIDLDLPGNWRAVVSNKLSDTFDFIDPTTPQHNTMSQRQWDEHVLWELKAMEKTNVILMNLLPEAKSPISLIETGLYVRSQKMIVSCPLDFYKRNYLEELCRFYNTPIYENLYSALDAVNNMI